MSEETTLQPRFLGKEGALFSLAFKTGLLTLITLGIYRFWAKTRIRRYIWSSVQIGDDVAEYTGTGLEKLMGFLVAVVVLAIYLGIVNIVLTFFGYNLIGIFSDAENATPTELVASIMITYVVFLSLFPLLFFAQYRSHRYTLSRTRWRGMRMALSPGAWGYAWRAVLYTLLAGMTMGITLPLQTLQLQKYITDRQWFGNAQFSLEGGEWTEMFHTMKHFLFAILAFIGAFIIMAFSEVLGVIAILIAYLWIFFGFLYFSIKSYIYLMNHTKLDGVIGFETHISVRSVVKKYIVGILIVIAISIAVFIPLGIALAAFEGAVGADNLWAMIVLMVVVYMLALTAINAAVTAFVAMPILAKFVTGTHIVNAEHLDTIQQREGDDIPDADGFADALDVGGAF
ncbi:MAG: DUF898 family protein [Planktomarina sp.]